MEEGVDEEDDGGGLLPSVLTFQTMVRHCQHWLEYGSSTVLTLVGVSCGALVCLRTVVSFVQALGATSDGDSVIVSQVPTAHRESA